MHKFPPLSYATVLSVPVIDSLQPNGGGGDGGGGQGGGGGSEGDDGGLDDAFLGSPSPGNDPSVSIITLFTVDSFSFQDLSLKSIVYSCDQDLDEQ